MLYLKEGITVIQDLGSSIFNNQYKDYRIGNKDKLIICKDRSVLLEKNGNYISFPTYGEAHHTEGIRYLFSINDVRYFMAHNVTGLSEKYEFYDVKIFRVALPKEERFAGITGFQLNTWYSTHKFCSCCGEVLIHDENERMLKCPKCNMVNYPTISPAVIVGVVNGNKILVTKYAGRDYKKYALIAGFTEIGETLEETVKREVMEEVSLKVKDIKYYGCQPWSFTNTLLVGFFAKVDGNNHIIFDQHELSEGIWIDRNEMDIIEDDGISLTRDMMMAFKNNTFEF